MEKLKHNLPLVVGLGIPVLMVLVIAGIIYGSRTLSNIPAPAKDFVYALGDTVLSSYGGPYRPSYPSNACASNYYRVASGTVVKYPSQKDRNPDLSYCKGAPGEDREPLFFRHDVQTNTSVKLTFAEVAKLRLDDSPKSSDGYEYTRDYYRGDIGFPFWGGSSYDPSVRYLKNETRYEKMNLQVPTETYYGEDVFLGWVVE